MKFVAIALVCACLFLALVQQVSGAPFLEGVLNRRLTREEHEAAAAVIQPQYLDQLLDHEDLSSNITFKQKYYTNDTYWNSARPRVFLMIGGEGPVSPAYLTGHFQIGYLASQFGALQVALEHRFYGESIPLNDSSTANLKYLSSSQALQDIIMLHETITTAYGPAQWIVFGGSYSGSLSAWARMKYPHLFLGSISASAPVRAKLDFFEYFQVVSNSVGSTCSAVIGSATAEVNTLLQTTDGRSKLQQAFNICAPIADADVANFVETLTGPIAETVQYNDDANRRSFDIPVLCSALESGGDALSGLANAWYAYNNHTGVTGCTDVSYANMILEMQPTSDARSWTWQTCIEFGYFQTGTGANQPFSPLITLDYYLNQCPDIFSITNLQPRINYINDYYGSDSIVTSNTVFTNGDVDPWHILGNYQNYTVDAASTSILIHGTAHCADLYPAFPDDLPGLTAARSTQESYMSEWFSAAEASKATPKPKPAAPKPKPAVGPKQAPKKHKIILTE